jgi:hypothetical protein
MMHFAPVLRSNREALDRMQAAMKQAGHPIIGNGGQSVPSRLYFVLALPLSVLVLAGRISSG